MAAMRSTSGSGSGRFMHSRLLALATIAASSAPSSTARCATVLKAFIGDASRRLVVPRFQHSLFY
jgi:hypothetical protein